MSGRLCRIAVEGDEIENQHTHLLLHSLLLSFVTTWLHLSHFRISEGLEGSGVDEGQDSKATPGQVWREVAERQHQVQGE
jgi:hypothetical protein